MLSGDKNLKDSMTNTDISVKDIPISYTKTKKLVTALYMVTDIIDKEEPIRNKLRDLGAEIISDTYSSFIKTTNKINAIVSFLDIASAMNFISEMNCAILKKEFFELKKSIHEYSEVRPESITEFFETSPAESRSKSSSLFYGHFSLPVSRESYKGHRIGVQKGSTLMKALSDRSLARNFDATLSSNKNSLLDKNNFEELKKKRREEIIEIIKNNEGSATITDIKNKAKGHLFSCSEKTLQRELISMVKDSVLHKTGEKRWSRYFVKN